MTTNLLIALATFGIGLPLAYAAMTLGKRLMLLDVPTAIKPHARPVPFTGGTPVAAIAVSTAAAVGLLPLAAGAAGVWAIGFVDDVRSLSPRAKLALEVLPILVVASSLDQRPVVIVLLAISGVVLINVFNVIDGLDGLAAGCALAPLLVLMTSESATGRVAASAAGCVLAFLVFNRHPAKLFLGDQGSLLLGFLLWALPLMENLRFARWSVVALWVMLWIFPILNAAYVVAFRLHAHRPIMRGDRSHLYDTMLRRFGLRVTLIACWSIAALGAFGAFVIDPP
jgi:UDP-GlcNAc:undecaprenyl-phosphate GlcNAc-1-phosphate transferase